MAYSHKRQYTDEQIKAAFQHLASCKTLQEAAKRAGVPASTLRHWANKPELVAALYPKEATTNLLDMIQPEQVPDVDSEVVSENVVLARKNQRLMDSNRIERKAFREHSRAVNMVEDLTQALIETFTMRKFHVDTVQHPARELEGGAAPIGVIQLSDLHINMVIQDVQENKFDLDIASRRICKHVCSSIGKFKIENVQKVVLALTGDLVKNIQHLSEISSNSTSRANATFIMVDILIQIIKQLNDEGFNVVVASVVGNESRATEHIHETDFLASDSFDLMIHKILQYMMAGKPGVEVLPMTNMLECVLNLNGSNLLLIHGHAHGRSAGTATLEKAFDSLAARYSSMGTRIDYMICGHIHQAYISDKFARSGGLPGTDEYAARKLNLWGRASQNAFIFYADGTIDGFKHDLQHVDAWIPYRYDEVAAALALDNRVKTGGLGHNMTISANGVPFAAYTV